MGRGTTITPLRLSTAMLDRIRAAIDSNNKRRSDEPYDLSMWIRQAIEERLAKLERGRKDAKQPAKPAEADGQAEPAEADGQADKKGKYTVRLYLASAVNAEGAHVGKWALHRFDTLEEARAFQEAKGGALYSPDTPRRRKGKRKKKTTEGGEGQGS